MRPAASKEAALWIPARLHRFALDVGSFVPEGFDAYARILHPLGKHGSDGNNTEVRWRDIAAANGRSVDDELRLLDLSSEPGRLGPSGEVLWDMQSPVGSLPRDIAERLSQTLGNHTRTPDQCLFAVWEGWGGLTSRTKAAPRFSVPGRDMLLFEGSISDATTTVESVVWSWQSASLWWPDDRAWCVSTEIDFRWTYVGGSQACIDEVLHDESLEAALVTPATVR